MKRFYTFLAIATNKLNDLFPNKRLVQLNLWVGNQMIKIDSECKTNLFYKCISTLANKLMFYFMFFYFWAEGKKNTSNNLIYKILSYVFGKVKISIVKIFCWSIKRTYN
jgi:ribosomal protein S7